MTDEASVPEVPISEGAGGNEGTGVGFVVFEVGKEVERFFDDSSLSTDAQPHAVILMGGPGSGKTFVRKRQYSKGYVLIDAPEIFLSLSRGKFLPFPGTLEEPMNWVGQMVVGRAIEERRNIVTEVIGGDKEVLDTMLHALADRGYKVQVVFIECSLETALERNTNRGKNNISAHYAEWFHFAWILEECTERLKRDRPMRAGEGSA
jgi:hypothetical protein